MVDIQVRTTEGLYRMRDNPGLWEHRGKVAVVGLGHSPTARRWSGAPEDSIGAWTILAIRKAIADSGVKAAEVDTLVLTRSTSTGSPWPDGQPIPEDFLQSFVQTSDPLDGIAQISGEWLLANMPELTNIKLVLLA